MSEKHPRILIVEDEALLAMELEQKLLKGGYDVTGIATTGAEAVQFATTHLPDLVLMDIKLPGMIDGIAAAEQIYAQADIPLIYLTSHADADTIARAKITAPSGYLLKPVNPSQLYIAITIAIHKHMLERDLREANARLTQAEVRIRHLNAVLRAIRTINQLITRETDTDRLLQVACQHLVATRGFSYAKIIPLDPSLRPIRAFEAGIGEIFTPFMALLQSGYVPYCLRQGLRCKDLLSIEHTAAVCGDCPLAALFWNDYKLIVRMEYADRLYGLLTVSLSPEIEVNAEELDLLKEVASDLAFALHTIEGEQERQYAEQELQKAEQQYRLLFTQMTNGFALHEIVLDVDHHPVDYRFLEVNPAFEHLTGLKKELILNHTVLEILPDTERFWIETYGTVALTGKPAIFEHYASQLQKYYAVVAYSPKTGQFATIFMDITERKQAEKALQESEERYRRITEAVTDYIYTVRVHDGQAVETIHGPACVAVTGYSSDEFRARPYLWFDMVHPEDRPAIQAYANSILTGKKVMPLEHRILRKDGTLRWVRNTAVPHYDANGRLISYDGLVRDITERKQAEEALRESEERFRQLVENINEVFWIRDLRTGQLLYLSPNYKMIWGFERQHTYQHSGEFLDTVHPEDRPAVKAAYQQSAERPISVEYRIVRPDGDIRWIWAQTFCLRNAAGEAIRQIGIAADITDRKASETELRTYREHLEELVAERTAELQDANRQLAREVEERTRIEEELQAAKEAAERANREKSAFLSNLSHDIRTPLNAILGFSQILKEQFHDAPHYQYYLDRISTSGDTLLRLINDVLDLSKIEAGQIDSRPETVPLRSILTEMEHLFTLKAREKNIQFHVQMDAAVPPVVQIDGVHLRQILINLIGNAIKFTEKGSVSLRVVELTELQGPETHKLTNSQTHKLLFEISDTGIGIPPDEQQRIFEPFHQATRHFGGTGLGLAISKRLTELMHGSLTVESTVNHGSTFTLILPGVIVVNAAPSSQPAVSPQPAGILHFDNATILVVEDHASNREILHNYLANHGLHILEAENGQIALDIFKRQQVDLILMDIQMPVMNGYEATCQIRAAERSRQRAGGSGQAAEEQNPLQSKIPIIAVTAYALKEQRDQFQNVFDAYLTKPVNKAMLLATIARFLRHSGGQTASSPDTRTRDLQQLIGDLRVYAPVSQPLRDRLQHDLLPQYEMCRSILSIDELLVFAETIREAGNEFQILPLIHYAEQLTACIKTFHIPDVKQFLAVFPTIVDALGGERN